MADFQVLYYAFFSNYIIWLLWCSSPHCPESSVWYAEGRLCKLKKLGKFSENIEATYSLETTYSLEWMKCNYSSFVFNNNSISICVR